MKRIRYLGLGVAMALTITAALGVSSASASALETTTAQYPTTVEGKGISNVSEHHTLVTNYYWSNQLNCGAGPAFSGTLVEATSQLTVTPKDATCTGAIFGSWTLKMNSCTFTLHFGAKRPDGTYAGTMDIGPSGCGPIKLEASCTVSIPDQKGLLVSFANVVKGSEYTVKLSADIKNLTYTQSGSCGGETGTFKNGSYLGNWTMQGNGGARPLDVTSAKFEEGNTGFVAEQYPATISGAQDSTQHQKLKFPKDSLTIDCKKATVAGELTSNSTTVSLTPSYSECAATGPVNVNAALSMNGCVYVAHSDTNALDINCPEGKAIEILAATCKIIIPAQKGLTSVSDEVTSASWPFGVTLNWNSLSKVAYKQIDAFLCPFSGNSENTDGSFSGLTKLGATNSLGATIGLWSN